MNESKPRPGNSPDSDTLPPAAQRWLARTLPEDHSPPAGVRIEQTGTMEVRGRWTEFEATGLYRANPLAYSWQARLKMAPGIWIVAEDGHEQGAAWGGARLWGVFSMGKRSDPQVLKTQLVRNLAELVWVPALALSDPKLEWSDAGQYAFEIRCASGEQEAVVRFELNDRAEVVRAHSPARPYDVPGGYTEAPWRYDFGNHREFDGIHMPAAATATFEKPEGPWQYMQLCLTKVGE